MRFIFPLYLTITDMSHHKRIITKFLSLGKIIKLFFRHLHSLNYKTLLIILVILLSSIVLVYKLIPSKFANAAWFNDSWSYRKSIALTDSASNNSTNYTVQLSIDTATLITATKLSSSCQDLRFTDIYGNLLKHFTSNCNSATSAIFVLLESMPASGTTIYMYYGNPGAADASNAPQTFGFTSEPITAITNNYSSLISVAPTLTRVTTAENGVSPLSSSIPMLKYTGTNDATAGNHYAYYSLTGTGISGGAYTIKSGDYLTWLQNDTTGGSSLGCGIEMDMSGGAVLRSGAGDQDASLAVLLNSKAYNNWYWRRVSLASYIGRTINTISFVSEGDTASTAWNCYFNNVVIRPYSNSVVQGSSGSEEKTTGPIAYWNFDEASGTTLHNQMEMNGEKGLIGWWKFDEGVGTSAVDQTGQNLVSFGTGSSAPSWVTGKIGIGLSFNGTTKYAYSNSSTYRSTSNWTIEAWVNPSSIGQSGMIFYNGNDAGGYGFGIFNGGGSNGAVFTGLFGSVAWLNSGYTFPSAGAWYHLAMTRDSSTTRFYVNGIQTPNTFTYTPNTVANYISIGMQPDTANMPFRLFNGSVDNVKSYNRALSAAEIAADAKSLQGALIGFGPLGAGATWADGAQSSSFQKPMGDSLYFNGTSQYVTIGTTISSVSSLSFWLKPSSTGTSIVDLDGGTHKISVNNGTLLASGFTSPSYYVNGIGSSTITLNTWNHVVITTATTFPATITTIGKSSSSYFTGYLDEFKIYPYVITPTKIAQEYNRGVSTALGVGRKTSDPSIAGGLVGWWKMDEAGGNTFYDSSGNNNTGTGISEPTFAQGTFGKAVNFTTSYQGINIPDSPLFGSSYFTASAWIKPITLGSNAAIINRRNAGNVGGFTIESPGQYLRCYAYISGSYKYIDTPTLLLNVWQYYACSYDGTNLKAYVNGINVGTTAISGTMNNPASAIVRIGQNSTNFAVTFNGSIDNVKLYNRALSNAEVTSDYNQGQSIAYFNFDEAYGTTLHNQNQTTSDNGLISFWKFNEGTGTTGFSETGANHMVLGSGGSAPTWVAGKVATGLNFNGTNQYSSYTDTSNSLGGNYTLSGWIYRNADNSASYERIFSKSDITNAYNNWMDVAPGNVLKCSLYTTSNNIYYMQSSITIPTLTWVHVACTFNTATGFAMYINGVNSVGTTAGTPAASKNTSNNFNFGSADAAGSKSFMFNGILDNFKIYNRTLLPSEIASEYSNSNGDMIGFGTIGAGATWVDGTRSSSNQKPLGKALNFNGTNQYVALTPVANGPYSRSVSAWVKGVPTSGRYEILNKNYNFFNIQNGLLGFYVNGAQTSYVFSSTTISPTSWNFVAGTYDITTGLETVYINGVNVGSSIVGITTDTSINATADSIGTCYYCGLANYFSGQIDELKYFPYALSQSDITTEYNRSSAVALGVGQNPNNASRQVGTTSSLVGWWKMDEASGNSAYDSSGNNLTGLGNTFPSWAQGQYGKALSFNGTNNNLLLPATSKLDLQRFTIQAWLYSSYFIQNGFIFEKTTNGTVNTQYSCFLEAGSGIVFRTSTATPTIDDLVLPFSSARLANNQWNQINCVYDGSSKLIYINGVLTASKSYSQTLSTNPAGTSFIGMYGGGGYYFKGKIDNLKIYNRALSSAEIAYDYNQGAPFVWYHFDEKDGSIASDSQKSSTTTNLLVNPSFENGLYGNEFFGDHTATQNGTNYVSGSNDARITCSGLNTGRDYFLSDGIAYSVGTTIMFSFYAKSNSGNTSLSYSINGSFDGPVATLTSSWQRFSYKFTDGSASSVVWWLGGAGTFELDNVQAEPYVGTASPYCDGSLQGSGNVWSGNPLATSYSTCRNTNDGTLGTGNSAPTWVAGKFGNALSFDGSNDTVITSSNQALNLSSGGSISAWIYPRSAGENNYGRVIDKSSDTNATGGYAIFMNGGPDIDFQMNGGSQLSSSNSSVPYNRWTHVVWTFDGSGWKLYINGKLNNSNGLSTLPPNVSLPVTIGNRSNASDRTFDGLIDEPKIYSYALTAAQVTQDMNNSSAIRF